MEAELERDRISASRWKRAVECASITLTRPMPMQVAPQHCAPRLGGDEHRPRAVIGAIKLSVACTWHVACGMWHVACGMWHVACGVMGAIKLGVACMWHSRCISCTCAMHTSICICAMHTGICIYAHAHAHLRSARMCMCMYMYMIYVYMHTSARRGAQVQDEREEASIGGEGGAIIEHAVGVREITSSGRVVEHGRRACACACICICVYVHMSGRVVEHGRRVCV